MSRLSTTSISRIQLTGVIHGPRHSLPVQILADSGAEGNFVDSDFVKENDFPVYKPMPKEVHAVDGRLLELITLKTELLKLTLSKNHHEFVVFCCNFPLYSCDFWCTLSQTDHSLHPGMPLRLVSKTRYRLQKPKDCHNLKEVFSTCLEFTRGMNGRQRLTS